MPQLWPACLQVVLGITILYCALHVLFLGNSGMQDTDIPLLLVGFTFGARWEPSAALWVAAWRLVLAGPRPTLCAFVELARFAHTGCLPIDGLGTPHNTLHPSTSSGWFLQRSCCDKSIKCQQFSHCACAM